jgi:hypothetical protein
VCRPHIGAMMTPNLTDNDRADLARFLVDRYPLSPRVRRLKVLLAKIDPVYWGIKLLRIKYGYSFPEMAELMIPTIFGLVIFGLVACRFLGVWPF